MKKHFLRAPLLPLPPPPPSERAVFLPSPPRRPSPFFWQCARLKMNEIERKRGDENGARINKFVFPEEAFSEFPLFPFTSFFPLHHHRNRLKRALFFHPLHFST